MKPHASLALTIIALIASATAVVIFKTDLFWLWIVLYAVSGVGMIAIMGAEDSDSRQSTIKK